MKTILNLIACLRKLCAHADSAPAIVGEMFLLDSVSNL